MPLAKRDIEIDQGFPWDALLILPGNRFMTGIFKGQIRRNPNSPQVLANFKFDFPRYREEANQTEIRVSLPKMTTIDLLPTGADLWVYDLTAKLADNTSYLLLAGYVQVFEVVTET